MNLKNKINFVLKLRHPHAALTFSPHQIILKTATHEEGCMRQWAIQAKAFISDADDCVRGLLVCEISWEKDPATGKHHFVEIPGSERELPCDLALIAIGYRGVEHSPLWSQLGLAIDEKGTVENTNFITSSDRVFAAGDARRGQSLVVWAIAEGREVARVVAGRGVGE